MKLVLFSIGPLWGQLINGWLLQNIPTIQNMIIDNLHMKK